MLTRTIEQLGWPCCIDDCRPGLLLTEDGVLYTKLESSTLIDGDGEPIDDEKIGISTDTMVVPVRMVTRIGRQEVERERSWPPYRYDESARPARPPQPKVEPQPEVEPPPPPVLLKPGASVTIFAVLPRDEPVVKMAERQLQHLGCKAPIVLAYKAGYDDPEVELARPRETIGSMPHFYVGELPATGWPPDRHGDVHWFELQVSAARAEKEA